MWNCQKGDNGLDPISSNLLVLNVVCSYKLQRNGMQSLYITNDLYVNDSEFIFDPIKWPREQMDEDFFKLSKMFNAMRSVVRVPDIDPKYKVAVLASKQVCLVFSDDFVSHSLNTEAIHFLTL